MKVKRQNRVKLTTQLFGTDFGEQNIYINESISGYTRQLFNAARRIKVTKQYKFLWVKDSTVLMRRSEGGAVVRIRRNEDLLNLY